MSFVFDASAALTCALMDDATERDTGPILERLAVYGAVVPAVFKPEILHALVKAERRVRGRSGLFDLQWTIIRAMPITVDPDTALYLESRSLVLARAYRLSIYDAIYLELAQRLSLPLATFDDALIRAAQAVGVLLLP